jgi:glycosyltransferase involved in cell wall biosynthesis
VAALNVIATVLVYNEADIIGQVLEHLHRHDISFVVLDGGSKDGSIEIAQAFIGKGLLEHKVVRRSLWEYRKDLDCVIEMAAKYTPDWIVCNDADEFLEPRELDQTLCDVIAAEDRLGYNIVQFDHFLFLLTQRDCESEELDIRKRLRFYQWTDDYRYKAWKYYPSATCRDGAGHYPTLPCGIRPKVSPKKLVLRHYPFRSPEQAMRKVFEERLPRFAPEERMRGWHVQYDYWKEDSNFFLRDSRLLSEYNEDGRWDMTRRPSRGPDWRFPTRNELFGQWSLLRRWLRYRRLLHNVLATRAFEWKSRCLSAPQGKVLRAERNHARDSG